MEAPRQDDLLIDKALMLSYQRHRNDSLQNLCFCDACKRIRTKINLLNITDIRHALGKAC